MKGTVIKFLLKTAWVLELAIALFILVITVVQMVLTGMDSLDYLALGQFSLDEFLANTMNIVVCLEFVKMLILHTPRAVTDVLLFAIARQLGLDGYNIVMVATGPQEKNQAALDTLRELGDRKSVV